MDLDTRTTHENGVTFVSVCVRNPHDQPAAFRLESGLDGPVWPPRRAGHPAPGWDETGFEGRLQSGERLSLGFSTPESPVDPAAVIAWERPATEADESSPGPSLTQRFADPRPPRSALSPSSPVELARRPSPGKGSGGYL